jgi:hypothetical protein
VNLAVAPVEMAKVNYLDFLGLMMEMKIVMKMEI